jgi:hypothetical protein
MHMEVDKIIALIGTAANVLTTILAYKTFKAMKKGD